MKLSEDQSKRMNELAKKHSENYWGDFDDLEEEEQTAYLDIYNTFKAGYTAAIEDQQCDFCKNTGKHLCPEIAEPILINCTKKGCAYGEIERLKGLVEKADDMALSIVNCSAYELDNGLAQNLAEQFLKANK